MKLYTLTEPVSIPGRTMFGLGRSTLICSPSTSKAFDPWVFVKAEEEAPLTIKHCSIRRRRIEASGTGKTIKAVEHIAVLRFLMPGIRITSNTSEIPYFTHAGALLHHLFQHKKVCEVKVPRYTIAEPVEYRYRGKRGGMDAFTRIEPNPHKELRIEVMVNFPAYGPPLVQEFVFPDESSLLDVLSVPSLGTPRWLGPLARWLWPHGRNIYWPKPGDRTAIPKIIAHRVQDILGAVALLPGQRYPSLTIHSQCSGHKADLKALQKVQIVPL
jgi:hypothetical protein